MPVVLNRPTGSRPPAPTRPGAAAAPPPEPAEGAGDAAPPPAPTPTGQDPIEPTAGGSDSAGPSPADPAPNGPQPAADGPTPPVAARAGAESHRERTGLELARPCWTQLAGRFLAVTGALLVAFALFQAWGTSVLEWRAQRAIDQRLAAELADGPAGGNRLGSYALGEEPTSGTPATGADPADAELITGSSGANGPIPGTAPTTAVTPAAPVRRGEPAGRIEIPAIGVSKVFLEGVDRDVLRDGPGHYPGTALPGHRGNAAIAGHRTTHGAPFADLDRLQPGDDITVTTAEGTFHYTVEAHQEADGTVSGHRIVSPDAVEVLADSGGNHLTLTACHPRYSARQRIVVTATLVGDPLPAAPAAAAYPTAGRTAPVAVIPAAGDTTPEAAAPAPTPAPAADPVGGPVAAAASPVTGSEAGPTADTRTLGWQPEETGPTLLWATVALLVGHASWILARVWRRRAAWLPLAPALGAALFACFVHLDRLLPAF